MKRLKTLCLILLIIFFGSLYQGAVLPFIEGVKYGLTIAKYETETNTKTEEFLMMDVTPKNENFVELIEINSKTGEEVLVRPTNISLIANAISERPTWLMILQSFYSLIMLVILVLGVWIPFLVVKILRSLQQSEVFDRINLQRINRIGFIILAMGIFGSIIQTLNVISAKHFVELAHFEFSYAKVIDFNSIIMGVIILIMNEVLKMAIEMKEEQDLTI